MRRNGQTPPRRASTPVPYASQTAPPRKPAKHNGALRRIGAALALVLSVAGLLGIGWEARDFLETKADADVVEQIRSDVRTIKLDMRDVKRALGLEN